MTSQRAEYALRAVVCLAERPEVAMTTAALAELTRVPGGYLSKVLQRLAQAGLVQGRRGQGGGFRLAVPAESLTVLQVINAVDPVPRVRACPLDCQGLRRRLCVLHEQLDRGLAAAEGVYGSLTVAELVTRSAQSPVLCRLAAEHAEPDDGGVG